MPAKSAVALSTLMLLLLGCTDQTVTEPANGPGAGAVAASQAAILQNPDPIVIVPLTERHAFTDNVSIQVRDKPEGRPTAVANLQDASNLFAVEITVQPGARFPWHTHPGPVLVAVTSGMFTYVYADDCIGRPYAEGTAFVDPGFANVHMGFNPSGSEETVLVAVFLGAPDAGPVTLPVDAATGAALDAKCGLT
jgi:hypothetical protein